MSLICRWGTWSLQVFGDLFIVRNGTQWPLQPGSLDSCPSLFPGRLPFHFLPALCSIYFHKIPLELKDDVWLVGLIFEVHLLGPLIRTRVLLLWVGRGELSYNFLFLSPFFCWRASGVVICTRRPHTGHFLNTHCAGKKDCFYAIGMEPGRLFTWCNDFPKRQISEGKKRLVWLLNNCREICR